MQVAIGGCDESTLIIGRAITITIKLKRQKIHKRFGQLILMHTRAWVPHN